VICAGATRVYSAPLRRLDVGLIVSVYMSSTTLCGCIIHVQFLQWCRSQAPSRSCIGHSQLFDVVATFACQTVKTSQDHPASMVSSPSAC